MLSDGACLLLDHRTRKALSGRNSYKTPVALVNDVCTVSID